MTVNALKLALQQNNYDAAAKAERALKAARRIYAEYAIPNGHRIWIKDENWRAIINGRKESDQGRRYLEEELWEQFKFKVGSEPQLAGYVIRAAHQLLSAAKNNNQENMTSAVQRMITCMGLLIAKLQKRPQKYAGSKSGKSPTSSRWAKELFLKLRPDHKTFDAAWNSIPDRPEDGLKRNCDETNVRVYRDGNRLCCEPLNKNEDEKPSGRTSLSKESLHKRYWKKI